MYFGPAFFQGSSTTTIPSPLVLPGLLRWYDASVASSITSAGNLCSQWNDLSGNNRHMTQSVDANKFVTGLSTVNGLNCMTGTGVQFMLCPYVSTAFDRLNTQEMYAFVVMGNSAPVNFSIAITFEPTQTGTPSQQYMCGMDTGSNSVINNFNTDTRNLAVGAGASDGSIHVIGYTEQYDLTSTIHYDAITGADVTSALCTPESLFHYGYVSSTWVPPGYGLWGTVCEVLYGNGPLTAAQITAVKNYLSLKWIGTGLITGSSSIASGAGSSIGASLGTFYGSQLGTNSSAMSAVGAGSSILVGASRASSAAYTAGQAVATGTDIWFKNAAASSVGAAVATADTRKMQGGAASSIGASTGTLVGAISSFVYTISADTNNFNIRTAAVAAGWDSVLPLYAVVTVNSGVTVGSTSTGTYAFDTDLSYPTGSSLSIVNNGTIAGLGGAGALGAYDNNVGATGSTGGPALRAQYTVSVTNNNIIGGGGGGGGGGGERNKSGDTDRVGGGGGGGGQGGGASTAGAGGVPTLASINNFPGNAGVAGAIGAAGAGGAGATGRGMFAGDGGAGGTLGVSGATGGTATGSAGTNTAAGPGGSAGACVVGDSFITWVTTGTRYGTIS